MRNKVKDRASLWPRIRTFVVGAAYLCGVYGFVWLGPKGASTLGVVLLAIVVVVAAVLFSPRDEPSQRLLELIKALWRDR